MHEILSNSANSDVAFIAPEIYELSLLHESGLLGTRHCIRQAHAKWSGFDCRFLWDEDEIERFWIWGQAILRYEERRAILVQKGFAHQSANLF